MIRTIRFQEFRALRDVNVSLAPLTVFVGPNGSGKTSILSGINELLSIGSRPRTTEEFDAYTSERVINTNLEAGAASIKAYFADDYVFKVTWQLGNGKLFEIPTELTGPNFTGPIRQDARRSAGGLAAIRVDEASTRFLRLVPEVLGEASYSDLEVPELEDKGDGLATVLNDLASSAPEVLERITKAVVEIVPAVRRIRTERAKVLVATDNGTKLEHRIGSRVILDTASGKGIPLSAASEGTALTVALMTVLYGRNPPTTLLMDDLDRALHPAAQRDLVKTLRAAMKDRPELQILATTHSPYLLDCLEFNEVRLTTLGEDGAVRCDTLEHHPDFERWKDMVTPGELWTSKMESWVGKGQR